MTSLEAWESMLVVLVQWLRVAVDFVGVLWVAFGFVYASAALFLSHLRRQTVTFTPIRLTLSRYLSLALEFQLASDILSTLIAPTWQDLGRLAATAAIRTALNYSLSREMKEYSERLERKEHVAAEHAENPFRSSPAA
ncbi:MAG: DUF1622 domain-containing protein [Bryobacteraceae bacterium]